MVAFHFQFSNQAGWRCDICRKSGLERKRRCVFLALGEDHSAPVVWARRDVALTTCPKSYVTAESTTLVEDFLVRRHFGRMDLSELTARQADAFLILAEAVAAETRNGQQDTRNAI
jgi:hypothetical protein